jgi:hypothetical protein
VAPLANNLTARLFVEYTSGGTEHTTLIRLEATATSTDGATMYGLFTTAAKGLMDTSDSFTGARFSAAGSNVSFPITVSAVVGTAAVSEVQDLDANFISATGRSLDGRRSRVGFFTVSAIQGSQNYRISAPSGAYATFLNFFTTNAANLRSASNSQVTWNSYLNYGISAYWQRELRKIG